MKSKKELVDLFLGQNDLPKYIVGKNEPGLKIARTINGVRFIDEFNDIDSWQGYPVVHRLSDIEDEAIVLNCLIGKPVFMKLKLDKAGISNIDILSLIHYGNVDVDVPFDNWYGFDVFYTQHSEEFDKVYELLSDEKSKDTFNRLIDFRLNYNLDAMSVFKLDNPRQIFDEDQYFEDFLELREEGESFVDVGGYDGNTTLQFVKRCPRYEKVYFFEPVPSIMEIAKKNMVGLEAIEYCPYAASDKKGILHFTCEGSSSRVSEQGEVELQAEMIDAVADSKVSFIKMDIEGSEAMAIDGTKETILKYHPRLAICVYHKPCDFIDIPRHVLSIRNDYDIYMRHYSENTIETVMFFIPRK